MERPRTYAHYLVHGEDTGLEDDLKPPKGPLPTRAWIRQETAERGKVTAVFSCLVEEFPGDHWDRTGDFVELLRWALVDHEVQVFYVWNEARGDWDRLSREQVSDMTRDW